MPTPDRIPDNPPRDQFHTLADDGSRYRVAGTTLGGHSSGSVVSLQDLGPGAQVQRLIDMGVLARLSDEEVDAMTAPRLMATVPAADDTERADPTRATGGGTGSFKAAHEQGTTQGDQAGAKDAADAQAGRAQDAARKR